METFASIITRHSTEITLWIGAICTFAIFSILYKENPVYRVFEHIFIGLAAGQNIYIVWDETLRQKWWEPMTIQGQWWWALAIIPGLMFYFIYSEKHGWIARLIMGVFMGLAAGFAFQDFANTYIPMVRGSFKPIVPVSGVGWPNAINNLIFVAVLITVMAYFFFSIDHKAPAVRRTATAGRWLLMFAFGAMFGATVMARMSLFIGRVDFLFTQWGPIVPWHSPYLWIAIVLLIAGVLALYLKLRPGSPGGGTDGDNPETNAPSTVFDPQEQ